MSHIGASEAEDTDYEKPEVGHDLLQGAQGGAGKFTDEDYTFVQPPALDASDMVNLVVPGEGLYAVPRHAGIGSTPHIQFMEMKAQDNEDWDSSIQMPPSERAESDGGRLSVDYPNVYLEEPIKEHSVTSSGPPRIPSRDKGKGRAKHQTSLDGIPLRLRRESLDTVSNKSAKNNPFKTPIHIPNQEHPMSPIPLISNIVKKMSLEHAKARTIGDNGSQVPDSPPGEDGGYDTLVNQLVSLVDVVSNLLEDDGVKHQIRGVWDGFSTKTLKEHLSPTTPGTAGVRIGDVPGMPGMKGKTREIALAEGLVNVMKRVATIVDEDEMSDVEEQDGDVIWTHPSRSRVHTDVRLPNEESESKPTTPTTRTQRADKTGAPAPPAIAKTSKQRLEEAKAVYKAEKARYRTERDQKRREKLASKGLMMPEPM